VEGPPVRRRQLNSDRRYLFNSDWVALRWASTRHAGDVPWECSQPSGAVVKPGLSPSNRPRAMGWLATIATQHQRIAPESLKGSFGIRSRGNLGLVATRVFRHPDRCSSCPAG